MWICLILILWMISWDQVVQYNHVSHLNSANIFNQVLYKQDYYKSSQLDEYENGER